MNNGDEIKLVAESLTGEDRWGINHWDWKPGVALYGLMRAYETTGNEAYLHFIMNWVERNQEQAFALLTINSTAPFLTVLKLYEATGEEKYRKLCLKMGERILRDAPITRDGGLEHTVTEEVTPFREQMWADTLFMSGLFLCRLGVVTGEKKYLNAAVRQFVVHHEKLKDVKTGLFYHGWNCQAQNWMSGALWGRANAWFLAATAEFLEMAPPTFSGRDFLAESMRSQASALIDYQRPDGLFGTLIDRIDSYGETSATAGIAYGLRRGVKAGLLGNQHLAACEAAEAAVMRFIGRDGALDQVSGGTPVMPALEDYKTIRLGSALYGQGLTLLMLCERNG